MTERELLHCPRCTWEDEESPCYVIDDETRAAQILCLSCGFETAEYSTMALAAEAWNTRAPAQKGKRR